MTGRLSLRLRLTLIILLPLLAISAAVAFWAARDAQARAADRFDRSLLVTALGISRDTAITGGDALSRDTLDLLRNTSGGPVFYHVYAPDGVFVTGYATPPVPPSLITDEDGYTYFDAQHLGSPVRAVRFSDRMDIGGLSGEFTFTVWQELALRDGFVASLSQRTRAVMATLVFAVALIVWFGVRFGLSPLLELEQAIARRSAADLTPIKRAIPPEVHGIVGRLNALLAEMSSTIQAKDSFISDAAHQLRNPIAGVLALSEAVAASKSEADFRLRSADLTEAAGQAAKLTEDLLAFERARSAPTPETLPVVDLRTILVDRAKRWQARAEARGVRVQLIAKPEAAPARLDGVLFEQAIENLIANAFAHGGTALSVVELRLERVNHAHVVTVSDDGQGLPPDAHEVALARFGQAKPGSGSGLGLPIAKAVAEAHGGSLSIEPRGAGFFVQLTLPVADQALSCTGPNAIAS